MNSVITPCRSRSDRRRALVASVVLSALLVSLVMASTWNLHGVISETAHPGAAPADGWRLLVQIVAANLGAVALAASGLVTAGFGSVVLLPIIATNLAILLGTGRAWLSPDAFGFGLAVHGGGEALAVVLGGAAGLYPVVLVVAQRIRGRRRRLLRSYWSAVGDTLPVLGSAVVIILLAAAWEVLISTRLV